MFLDILTTAPARYFHIISPQELILILRSSSSALENIVFGVKLATNDDFCQGTVSYRIQYWYPSVFGTEHRFSLRTSLAVKNEKDPVKRKKIEGKINLKTLIDKCQTPGIIPKKN